MHLDPGAMRLCPLLLWLPLSLALSVPPGSEAPGGAGELRCGPRGLQFTVHPQSPGSGPPPALIAWDDHGLPHRLQNDSGCGTQVTAGPGSALLLEAAYGGCYVTEWGSQHVMPVGLGQADAAGHRPGARPHLLRCPMDLPGLDALGADLCESVPEGDRLPCAPAPASPRACQALGCCYHPASGACYYGNTVTSRCSRDGHFAVAVARGVTSPPLLLDSVHLALGNDSECRPLVVTPVFALFRFPFTACGTTRRVTGDQAVYENELVAAQDVRTWSRGSITRDSTFRLRVSCTYPVSSSALPVNVQVSLLPPPFPESQPGALTLELQIAKDGNFSSFYGAGDFPVVKLLRDPVYVEVAVRRRTDPALGLLLRRCWATSGPEAGLRPQWPLLEDGCPYAGDNYQTQLVPVPESESLPFPSHAQRFSIFTFSFVNEGAGQQLGGQVFLHCSVSVCQPAGSLSCASCPSARRRRSSEAHDPSGTASISSLGPMILLQAPEDPPAKLPKDASAVGDSHALWVAGLSGTLIVGVLGVTYLAVKKWS